MRKGIKLCNIKYTFPVVRKNEYTRPIVVRVEEGSPDDGVNLLVAFFFGNVPLT